MMFGIQTAIPGGSNPPLANSSPNLLNKMNENDGQMVDETKVLREELQASKDEYVRQEKIAADKAAEKVASLKDEEGSLACIVDLTQEWTRAAE